MVKWNMKLMYDYCKEHNYDLPKENQIYTNLHNKYIYICPKHGEYLQEWNKHRYGHGCSKCGGYMDRQGRLQKQQYRDKLKRDYAVNNGYTLLEPTYKLNSQEKVNKYLDNQLIT